MVRTRSATATRGHIEIGAIRLACALGRTGIRWPKREGDGATPAGAWQLTEALWRPDRGRRPLTPLPCRPIRRDDGWCDDPADRNYNHPVRHPYPASAERLWRDDGLYDLVVVLDHNRRPRVRGHGSAVFMHVARPGLAPTEGCVALSARDLRKLLVWARRGDEIVIGAPGSRR
ncbi:MAG: L,D-transpeptidase [Hyphomicrobiaceae bacterium]